ncbi:MAG: autotransporter-associated beta strand repeat-containing protein [Pirellulales bacterium]
MTITGNIIRNATSPRTTSTVTLNGPSALLDMSNRSIGSATALITFNAQAGTLRNLAELNGGGTLDKTTAGTLVLDTANAYTGLTTVTAGILHVMNGGALGSAAAGTSVADGATLQISGDVTTLAEVLTLAGLGVGGNGALRNLSGTNTYTGPITLASASRIQADAGTLNLDVASGNAVSGAFDLSIGGAGNISVADAINIAAGNLTKFGAGTVTMSSPVNTYTGVTTLGGGTLSVAALANGGADSSIGSSSFAAGNLVFDGGTLQYTGGSVTTDRNYTIAAGKTATINVSTAGAVLTMTGNAPTTTGGLTKAGPGTLTMANSAYNHAGATTVSGGTLNTADDAVFAGNFVVSGGTFSPGTSANGTNHNGIGQASTTSAAASVFNTGSTFVFDFSAVDTGSVSAPTNWDFLHNAAGLTLTGGASYTLQIRSWLASGLNYGVEAFDANADTSTDLSTMEGSAGAKASYRWLWIDNDGTLQGDGVSGGKAEVLNQFVIDTSLFDGNNPFSQTPPVGGHFWVSAYNNDLYINYSSVPEPGSLLFVGLAGLGLAAYRRRKRKAEQTSEESGAATENHAAPQA